MSVFDSESLILEIIQTIEISVNYFLGKIYDRHSGKTGILHLRDIYRTKVKTLHFYLWSKWPKSVFHFNFFFSFCKIKCLTSSYYLCCTYVSSKRKPKNEIFMYYFILYLKNEIRAIIELECTCVAFSLLFSMLYQATYLITMDQQCLFCQTTV